MGKTIIVVSKSDNVCAIKKIKLFYTCNIFIQQILRHCQNIYVFDEGQISGYMDYDDIQKLASYQEMVNDYQLQRTSIR